MTVTDALRERAPAKLNVCLFLGPVRPSDGRHELVTVFQPLTLADDVTLEPLPLGSSGDEVVCPGVPGRAEDNLAAAALRAFRARTGWSGPPVRLRIHKRIPIAAGMAGGSADAAATLRLAARAAGIHDEALLRDIAASLGADVPAQVRPGRYLGTGAGEQLQPLPEPPPYGVVILRAADPLSTADVFRKADEMGLPRERSELEACRRTVASHCAGGLPEAMVRNDLEPAARALYPPIGEALQGLRETGARRALVCGSGPTVVGIFSDVDAARGAAVALGGRTPAPLVAEPWREPAREVVA